MPESSLTYTDLLAVDFGTLKSTVEDWNSVQKALTRLSAQAKDDLKAKSEAADWAGLNADKVRPFVREIADEVGDLHTEARSIWNVLDDAHRELVRIQGQIEDEREKAKRHQIRIHDKRDGTVTCSFEPHTDNVTTPSGYYVGGSADKDDPVKSRTKADRELRDNIEATLNRLIGTARDIDASTTWALAKSHGNDRNNAGHATYTSLNDAQASQATGLAGKQLKLYRDGKELSTEDLTRLAQLTKYNAKDPEFTTEFYRDLGPKKALMLHAQLGIDGSADGGKHRMELARIIQNSMGTGLAEATRPPGHGEGDKPHLSAAWIESLRKTGRSNLPLTQDGERRTPGYQILGNLLRHGTYDKKFLSGVAQDMLRYEREQGGPANAWPGPPLPDTHIELSVDKGKDRGFDPMTGLMKGLSHSPDAATEFFRGETTVDDERVDNLAYFLGSDKSDGGDEVKPREWPTGESGKSTFGDALEAGTTGVATGSEGNPPKHSKEQASLFYDVVNRLGSSDGASLVKHGGELEAIQPNMGSMAANYMHDVHHGIARSPQGIVGTHGEDANLRGVDGAALQRYLSTASQNSDGYASIMHASHAVSRDSIQEAMSHSAPNHNASDAASTGARPGADVAALASEGRADGIEAAENKVGAAEEYNKSLETKQEIVGQVVDLGVGMMPRGGEAAGFIAGEIQGAIFDSYQKDPETIAEEVQESRKDFLEDERRREGDVMERITRNAGKDAGVDPTSVDWAATRVNNDVADGYRTQ